MVRFKSVDNSIISLYQLLKAYLALSTVEETSFMDIGCDKLNEVDCLNSFRNTHVLR